MPQNALDEYKFLVLPLQSLKTKSDTDKTYPGAVKTADHLHGKTTGSNKGKKVFGEP